MARPQSIQTETILEATRKVFMRDGYQAGTARIAREAGGTAWEEYLMASVGKTDPQKALGSAGIHLLEQLRLTLPRLMMVSASGVTIPNHDLPGEVPHPVQKMDALCRYFSAEIRAKRLSMDSPRIQAHLFLGALAHTTPGAKPSSATVPPPRRFM